MILGAASLVSLALFGSGIYLGLGKGGMERMIAYPVLLGAISLGGYFIGDSKNDE
jgi:multisubunit Na+/H+ antiporter MnhC subunit